MMHIDRTLAADKPKAACIRDYAELMRVLEPTKEILKAVPLKHVRRRLHEIVAERPHLAEEAPLALRAEKARRAQYTTSPLQLAR